VDPQGSRPRAAFGPIDAHSLFFVCGWSLLSHGVAERKRLNLGNLNPIYEKELTKLDVHQEEDEEEFT
jgi:hypothetical protein